MDENFNPHEDLLRAVYPPEREAIFWDGKRLAPAAFIDPEGLSVDRTYNRSIQEAVIDARSRLTGFIVSIGVPFCHKIQAKLVYKPSRKNKYHSEIHGSGESKELTDFQALQLARNAYIQYKPSYVV